MKSEIRNPKSETSPKGQIQNPKDEGDALPWSLELRHSGLLRNSGFGIRAFSLIEVLVVVSIIIILVGLALAGINLAYQRGEESAARALLGTLAGVEKEYRAQTGQSVPATANEDLDSDTTHFLYIVQDGSSVARDMLRRIPAQYRTLGTIAGSEGVTEVKDPWDTLLRYNDGTGDTNNASGKIDRGMPSSTYPYFGSAGADTKFGRWDTSTDLPATTGTDWDADTNSVPDAKDNLYSFEVK